MLEPERHVPLLTLMQICIFLFLQNDTYLQCHYFDENGRLNIRFCLYVVFHCLDDVWITLHVVLFIMFTFPDFLWKTDGCETNNSQTYIICNCNHATPFAVLLVGKPSFFYWFVKTRIYLSSLIICIHNYYSTVWTRCEKSVSDLVHFQI